MVPIRVGVIRDEEWSHRYRPSEYLHLDHPKAIVRDGQLGSTAEVQAGEPRIGR
jgi:hypothetical protein